MVRKVYRRCNRKYKIDICVKKNLFTFGEQSSRILNRNPEYLCFVHVYLENEEWPGFFLVQMCCANVVYWAFSHFVTGVLG